MQFSNNVINGIPSKGHSFYVKALSDINPSIFNMLKLSLGTAVNIHNTNTDVFTKAYIWDLYNLANIVTSLEVVGSRFKTINWNNSWAPLFVGDFSDNSGDSIYKALPNFFNLPLLNMPTFSANKYTASFSFSPLISDKFNEQFAAEYTIYRACLIPVYPLIFMSTIPSHYSFGPAFLSSFRISMTSYESLPTVTINCTITGGKSLISNSVINGAQIYKVGGTGGYVQNMKSVTSENYFLEGDDYGNKYRSANSEDCIVLTGYYPTLALLMNATNISSFITDYKIVGMTLNIDQNLNLEFTYPSVYGSSFFNGNNYMQYAGDRVGPKFLSLKSRIVSGSITYFSYSNTAPILNTSGLTMYFGGPFLFPMYNVDWSNPVVTVRPNGGYQFEYKFIARFASNANITAFAGSNNYPVSEFRPIPIITR